MKLSIIVPVYNAEKTIEKCLNSLMKQNLIQKEIIVINDGSSDNSLLILNKYASQYDNIIVLNQINKGQGPARNRALEIARGEYITFVDSDDYISGTSSYKKLLERFDSENLDLIIFNYCMQYPTYNKKVVEFEDRKIYSKQEILEKFLSTNEVEGFACNKIFKQSIIKNNKICFLEGQKFEDIPFVVDYIIKSERIAFDDNIIYHYVHNPLSTTRKINVNVLNDEIQSMKIVLDKINSLNLINSQYILKYAESKIKLYKKYRLKNLLKRKISLKEYLSINNSYNKFINDVQNIDLD